MKAWLDTLFAQWFLCECMDVYIIWSVYLCKHGLMHYLLGDSLWKRGLIHYLLVHFYEGMDWYIICLVVFFYESILYFLSDLLWEQRLIHYSSVIFYESMNWNIICLVNIYESIDWYIICSVIFIKAQINKCFAWWFLWKHGLIHYFFCFIKAWIDT